MFKKIKGLSKKEKNVLKINLSNNTIIKDLEIERINKEHKKTQKINKFINEYSFLGIKIKNIFLIISIFTLFINFFILYYGFNVAKLSLISGSQVGILSFFILFSFFIISFGMIGGSLIQIIDNLSLDNIKVKEIISLQFLPFISLFLIYIYKIVEIGIIDTLKEMNQQIVINNDIFLSLFVIFLMISYGIMTFINIKLLKEKMF